MKKYDVVIVGGGTAGLLLARELSKLKHTVLLVDRKKDLLTFSFNTLGSFLNLEQFGLTHNVVAQDIDTIALHSKRVKRKIKSDLYILDKKQVHVEILEAIDKDYVTIKTGVNIKNIENDENRNFKAVIDQNKEIYQGKLFVDASGTNGVLSKKAGLIPKKTQLATGVEYNVQYFGKPSEGHLLIGKTYQGGYGWIFPLKNQRAIIGFGTFDDKIIKDLKNRLHKILELPNIKKLVKKDNDNVEGGSIPITPVLDNLALKNNDLNLLENYETDWRNRFKANYSRSKRAQERFFKYSQNSLLMDYVLLISKLYPDARAIRSLSGEYGLEND
jgi:digeranylgeranylglycerophospholipid reductase